MASEVSICNIALTALGAQLITSLSDDQTEAKLCDANYDPARDSALEARAWTFATKRAALALKKTAPVWGFTNAFQLPTDLITVLEMRDALPNRVNFNELMNPTDWLREEDTIVTDAATARIRYIARITDPNRYTAAFIHVVAARLAYEIAIAITQSRELQSDMWDLYNAKLQIASATDGMQGRSRVIRATKLTGIRGVGASINDFASGTV